MGLFRRSKEFLFGTYNCVKPHANLIKQRKGNSFIEERGKLGGAVIEKKKKSIGRNWEFEVWWLFTGSVVTVSH